MSNCPQTCPFCGANVLIPQRFGVLECICKTCGGKFLWVTPHPRRHTPSWHLMMKPVLGVHPRAVPAAELDEIVTEQREFLERLATNRAAPILRVARPATGFASRLFLWLVNLPGLQLWYLRATLRRVIAAAKEEMAERRRFERMLEAGDRSAMAMKRVGDAFERYVGRIFEDRGYTVWYHGLGILDGGIDLVFRSKSETLLVQCKYFTANRSVDLETVRALLFAVDRYRSHHTNSGGTPVRPVITTTSTLTYSARREALIRGVKVLENVPFSGDWRQW